MNPLPSSDRLDRRAALKWMLAGTATLMVLDRDSLAQSASAPGGRGYGTDPDLIKEYKPGDYWPLTLNDHQRRTAAVLVLKGFAAAVFIHGLYDTFAMEHGSSSVVMLLLLVAALFFAGRFFFKTGKELSAARWANPEAAAQIRLDTASQQAARIVVRYGEDKIGIDAEGRFYLKPEKQTWKLVTGRLLYVFSFACWVLFLVVGYNASDEAALAAVFYFCLTMTCVPTVLAVLLTRSYRQRLESNTYL